MSEKITSNASKVVRLRTYDMVNHVEVLVEYSVSDNLAVSDTFSEKKMIMLIVEPCHDCVVNLIYVFLILY